MTRPCAAVNLGQVFGVQFGIRASARASRASQAGDHVNDIEAHDGTEARRWRATPRTSLLTSRLPPNPIDLAHIGRAGVDDCHAARLTSAPLFQARFPILLSALLLLMCDAISPCLARRKNASKISRATDLLTRLPLRLKRTIR